jgi:hypothetical protein
MPEVATTTTNNHDIFVTMAVELIGVSIMALIAGTSEGAGNVVVIIMVGFIFVWLITHISLLQQIVGEV